jgi:hypothetical protein
MDALDELRNDALLSAAYEAETTVYLERVVRKGIVENKSGVSDQKGRSRKKKKERRRSGPLLEAWAEGKLSKQVGGDNKNDGSQNRKRIGSDGSKDQHFLSKDVIIDEVAHEEEMQKELRALKRQRSS